MFSVRGQIENSLGFVSHLFSVAAAQLGWYSLKAALDNTNTNENGCVQIKLSLWTLKFEFYRMCMCHKIFCSFF